MLHALIASVVLGAAMTFGDWLWAALHIRHTVSAGLLHGALICLLLGGTIGLREGRIAAGAVAGPLIGVAAAGVFYLLASSLRMAAMFPAWMFFWICFALLQAWMRPGRRFVAAIVRDRRRDSLRRRLLLDLGNLDAPRSIGPPLRLESVRVGASPFSRASRALPRKPQRPRVTPALPGCPRRGAPACAPDVRTGVRTWCAHLM